MFSVPGPENEDRRDLGSSLCPAAMVSGWFVCGTTRRRVTTYVWAIDDGSPGGDLIAWTKKSMCQSRAWIAQRYRVRPRGIDEPTLPPGSVSSGGVSQT